MSIRKKSKSILIILRRESQRLFKIFNKTSAFPRKNKKKRAKWSWKKISCPGDKILWISEAFVKRQPKQRVLSREDSDEMKLGWWNTKGVTNSEIMKGRIGSPLSYPFLLFFYFRASYRLVNSPVVSLADRELGA